MGLPRSTYYDAPAATADETEIVARIEAICEEFEAYGYRRVGAALRHQGIIVNSKKVRRLMREHDLQPRRRKRFVATTDSDHDGPIFPNLAKDVTADGPNQLWVADITYVATWAGFVYVAFITDVFSRKIVGWRVSNSLRSDLALDALDQALHARPKVGELIHHSDRGVQYLCVRYSERLADNDIVASVGSKGDSYDNAMAESFNGLYKWELIYPQGPWRGLDDVEFATMTYVDWFNHRRLHSELSQIPPAEHETLFYDHQPAPNEGLNSAETNLH